MESAEKELTLLLHCRNLPGTECVGRTGLRLGVQRGDVVIEDVPADREKVIFSIPLRVIPNGRNGQPDFRGPFVHGKVGERFLYLCWGERVGEAWDGVRRAKLYLRYLSQQLLQKALHAGIPIGVHLDMTDAKGFPLTASIREDDIEWRLEEKSELPD
jgi:hypothetical protein